VGEHLETYLRWVFGFIGVKDPEFISADGVQVGPEHREKRWQAPCRRPPISKRRKKG
jgi:FMN-dependent NADH-azoreductase